MLDVIKEIWNYVLQVINNAGQYLDSLVNDINNISFETNDVITKSLGTIRYILGDTLYLLLIGSLSISIGLLLWKMFKKLLNVIISTVPGLKGKIKIG